MSGRGRGTLSRGRHNHDPGVSVTCDTLSSEHRECCDHAEADTRGHRIRMCDQLVSYLTSADRDTGNVDTVRRVSPVLF